jgi:hypothetical protein
MIAACLGSTVSTLGQELKYADLATMSKRGTGYKSYVAKDSSVYKIGDRLVIGTPMQGTAFTYVLKGTGLFALPLSANAAHTEIKIKQISALKAGRTYAVTMTATAADTATYTFFSLDEAMAKGEIVLPGKSNTSDMAGLERVNAGAIGQGSAPDRVNYAMPQISDKVLWSLTEATGWMNNNEGQWIEGKNKIQQSIASIGSKENWDKEYYIPGADNFIRFELREITVEGKQWFLLTKDMIEGRWKSYPIESDWVNERKVKYVVFKRHGAKIDEKKVEQHSYPYYKSSCFYLGEVPYSQNYLNEIVLQLSRPSSGEFSKKPSKFTESSETYVKLGLIYKPLPDGVNCRFYLDILDEDYLKSGGEGFRLEARSKFNMFKFAPRDLYYECPKGSVEGLVSLVTKQ